ETMIWQPEFTDKTLSRKPGAVQCATACASCHGRTTKPSLAT
ncbi:EAST1 family heat-stable enterotoxin, partial [Escherichia coli]|nr:EAST1 family heat-stable enterotoxin [Escherichia coli]